MKKQTTKQMNDLRVYWMVCIPGGEFFVPVLSLAEATKILDTLADYTNFLIEHGHLTDEANTSGVEELVDGAWVEWEDADCNNIGDLTFEEVLIADANRRRGT